MKPITIAASSVNAKLVDATKEDKLLIQQLLSYTVDGFEHMPNVGGWNGRSSFFEYATGMFPAGFVIKVMRELKRVGRQVNIVRKPLPAPLGPEKPVVDKFPEDPRYDYQGQTVEQLLRYGQIIAQIATGGGKSRIAKLAFSRIYRPTLFLTTRGILMHQMRDAFVRDLNIPVSIFGDDNWDRPGLMNVGMVQSFAARLANPDPSDPPEKQAAQRARQLDAIQILQHFEVLILEEAHEASSDSYYFITQVCRNAHYRLALTATPFMKDSQFANMQLEACSGPVAIKVSELMLIQRGILAKPYFKYINTGPAAVEGYALDKDNNEIVRKLYKSTPYALAYEIGITGHIARNQAAVQEASIAVSYGLTAMVLVQHKSHGKRITRMLNEAGLRVAFIQGENDQNERLAAINALKQDKIDVLVGTNILDVGVDVPAVYMVILAGGGKAEVAQRQRIGRGARAKGKGMINVFFVVDFVDPVNNHLRDHARERRRIVDTTPGFAEGVVSEFPYESLGFVRKAA